MLRRKSKKHDIPVFQELFVNLTYGNHLFSVMFIMFKKLDSSLYPLFVREVPPRARAH